MFSISVNFCKGFLNTLDIGFPHFSFTCFDKLSWHSMYKFFSWTWVQRRVSSMCVNFCRRYAHFWNLKYWLSAFHLHPFKRGSRGGTGGPDPPPWDLSMVGSCVEAWWVGEGVQRLFLPYFWQIFFRLASLASIIKTYYLYIRSTSSMFSMERHPFSIFLLSKLWQESNFQSRTFRHFHIILV